MTARRKYPKRIPGVALQAEMAAAWKAAVVDRQYWSSDRIAPQPVPGARVPVSR